MLNKHKLDDDLFLAATRMLGHRAKNMNRALRQIHRTLCQELPEDLASDYVYEVIDFDRLIEELRKDPVWLNQR